MITFQSLLIPPWTHFPTTNALNSQSKSMTQWHPFLHCFLLRLSSLLASFLEAHASRFQYNVATLLDPSVLCLPSSCLNVFRFSVALGPHLRQVHKCLGGVRWNHNVFICFLDVFDGQPVKHINFSQVVHNYVKIFGEQHVCPFVEGMVLINHLSTQSPISIPISLRQVCKR